MPEFIRTFTSGKMNQDLDERLVPNGEYRDDKNTDLIKPILVDTKNILKFSKEYLITGVNLLEDLLFWTDNQTEPKKINIKDWENSTSDFQTHSIIYSQPNTSRPFIERDVVVIKPAPLTQPILTLSDNLGEGSTTTNAVFNFVVSTVPIGTFGDAIAIGDSVTITLSSPINVSPGETLNFSCDTPDDQGNPPVDDEGEPDVYKFTISVVSMGLGGTVLNGVIQSGTAELLAGQFDYEVEWL